MLQHELEQEDFGLKERLSQHSALLNDQRRKLLGSKVLSLFKKISTNASLSVKIHLVTALFALLEKLTLEMDEFAETVFRLLIYLLVEWHDTKLLRNHLLANFLDLFNTEKVLQLHALVEPLCQIITMNLEREDSRKYLNMGDFSFMWALANKNRLSLPSALAIATIMQTFMVRRDPAFRGVAEKIFFKLVSKFPNDDQMRLLLQNHASECISELAIVDNLKKKPFKADSLMSPRSSNVDNTDNFEM